MAHFIVFLACLLFCTKVAYAFDDKEILERFQLVPEPVCQKAKLREPREFNTPFFSERHFLSIDGGKECQIFDVWVAPLTTLPYENRRYMDSALYRRRGKTWVREFGLAYIPKFRLMDKKTGKVYLYIYLDESPFYKDEIVYFNGMWEGSEKEKSYIGNIKSLGDCDGEGKNDCLVEAKLVSRAVELFKQK